MRSLRLPPYRARMAVGVLMVVIVVLSALTALRGHGVDNHPGGFSLGHGETTYREDDVVFTFGLIAPRRVDPDQLFAEIVLLSDGDVVEHVVTNASVEVGDELIPGLRLFENVSVPHHGRERDSLGFVITLRHKGTVVDQYIYQRVAWDG